MRSTTVSNAGPNFATSPTIWHKVLIFTLGFWLGSSFFLDFILMPSLYQSGMMTESGFATAGYALFGTFNHVELVCAAIVLTGVLAQRYLGNGRQPTHAIMATLLLMSSLVCTYFLTPSMSALGLQLTGFANEVTPAIVPATMNQLHVEYWLLELFKLAAGSWLLVWSVNALTQSSDRSD